jgi:hypothetical protein
VDGSHHFNFLFYAVAYIDCGKHLTVPAWAVVYYQENSVSHAVWCDLMSELILSVNLDLSFRPQHKSLTVDICTNMW